MGTTLCLGAVAAGNLGQCCVLLIRSAWAHSYSLGLGTAQVHFRHCTIEVLWLSWSRGPISLVKLKGLLTRNLVETGQQLLGLPFSTVGSGS